MFNVFAILIMLLCSACAPLKTRPEARLPLEQRQKIYTNEAVKLEPDGASFRVGSAEAQPLSGLASYFRAQGYEHSADLAGDRPSDRFWSGMLWGESVLGLGLGGLVASISSKYPDGASYVTLGLSMVAASVFLGVEAYRKWAQSGPQPLEAVQEHNLILAHDLRLDRSASGTFALPMMNKTLP